MKKLIPIIFLLIVTVEIFPFSYWEKVGLPEPYNKNYWLDIYFHPDNPNYGWACGFNGMVVRTTDGGASWAGSMVSGAYHLEHIHFPTLQIGYVSGVEGIFKSVNGGANWYDITPDQLQTYWGCYFLNADTGWVVGGGCADNIQRFYKTTNGGSTWTVFATNEPNSGMTDLIVYPDGTGYAASSGVLWKTTDMGNTWFVYSRTGAKVWHEEITQLGNSFLLPAAGTNCSGSGNVGGILFSTDGGANWNRTIVRAPLFGTFLTSAITGWACGYDRQVYYTSNGGITWNEYNCGIDSGNLDDIWFITPTNGWVVGEGIYKLSAPSARATPQSVNFGNVCIGATPVAKIWVRNLSFYSSIAQFYLTGANVGEFAILSPNSTEELLNSCDSLPIIVQFKPNTTGMKYAQLNISLNGKFLTIPLQGFATVANLEADRYEITLNSVSCGIPTNATFYWTSTTIDTIYRVQQISGSPLIQIATQIPIEISETPQATNFSINPPDTGWYSATFEVSTKPCGNKKFVTIRAYAVSPILNAPNEIVQNIECETTKRIFIPIINTGNGELIISSVNLIGNSSSFRYIGFIRNSSLPAVIPINSTDTLIIEYNYNGGAANVIRIELMNNDATRARGSRNPYYIDLKINYNSPNIIQKNYLINLDTICLGDEIIRQIEIENNGNLPAEIQEIEYKGAHLDLKFNSQTINSFSKQNIILKIIPKKAGYFVDTLNFKYEPCNKYFSVVFYGFCLDSKFEAYPDTIELSSVVGIPVISEIKIKSSSNAKQKIKNVFIEPNNKHVNLQLLNSIPIQISPNEEIQLLFSIQADDEGTWNFKICIDVSEECHQEICLPVKFTSYYNLIKTDLDTINFGVVSCKPSEIIRSINLKNESLITDTIVSIYLEQANSSFYLIYPPKLPIILASGEELRLNIGFYPPGEGKFQNKLIIKTQGLNPQTIEIPMFAEYKTIILNAERSFFDFGKIEKCFENIHDTLVVSNLGLLDDTLVITPPSSSFIRVNHPMDFFIRSNDMLKIPIELLVETLQNTGYYSTSMNVRSKTCGNIIEFTFVCRKIEPQLSVNPTTLDFGEIWMDDTKTLQFEVSNISDEIINYRVLGFEPENGEFTTDYSQFTINPTQKRKHSVTFEAKFVGNKTATVLIEKITQCRDTLRINLKADVPREIYYPYLIIDDYTATPGDTLCLLVQLDTALPKVRPEKVNFVINLDRFLFEPLKVEAVYDSIKSIDFTFRYNNLYFTIYNAENIFTKKGNIIRICGIVLLSKPTKTPVKFEKVDIETQKQVMVITKNGALEITGYCPSREFTLIQQLPYIKSIVAKSDLDKIILDIKSSGPQKANIKIYSIYGSEVLSKNIDVNEGNKIYEISVNNISNGLYFMLLETEYDQKLIEKILIVK